MNAQGESSWRRVHPFVLVSFLIVYFILAFLWTNPLFLLVQLMGLLIWFGVEKKLTETLTSFRFTVWIMLFFMVINPLFQSNGTHFLWRGPLIAVIGRLDLSLEELLYSWMGVLRLSIILLLSCAYQWFVDHDRFLFFFARLTPRFVMASVMAIRLFPYMRQELRRIQEVMYTRGIRPTGQGMRAKINYSMLLLRPLIYSTMEGSWMMGESLYARGFGSGQRTFYRTSAMNRQERMALVFIGLLLLFGLFGKLLSFGEALFYPRFIWRDPIGDGLLIAGIMGIWVFVLIWMRRGRVGDEDVSS